MKMVKRVLCMLVVILLMVLMTVSVVFAADSSPGNVEEQGEFLTWVYLGTMGGAVAATTFIVQFLKVPIDRVWKIPTQFIVYFISLALMLVAEYVLQGQLIFERTTLIVINAIIVAATANKAYELTFKRIEKPG